MITEFKIFESNNKKFWTVKTDGYFLYSLYKIGMPFHRIKTYSYLSKNLYSKNLYIEYDGELWTWMKYDYTAGNTLYAENEHEYMGDVEVTEEDIKKYEDDKEIYDLQNGTTVKKYNI